MASPAKKKKTLLKVMLVGESQTGKTNILSQYCSKRFTKAYKATIGADFMVREIEVDGRLFTIQIWDTAGQERFKSLGTAFYRGSDACILVYDCNNIRSVEGLQTHYDEFVNATGARDPASFPFLILGNKVDLGDDTVVNAAATKFHATQIGNGSLFKCSALNNTGIDEAFMDLIRRCQSRDTQTDALPSYIPIEEPIRKAEPSPWATPASSGGWFSSFMAAGLEAKKKLDAKKAADAADGKSSPATPSPATASSDSASTSTSTPSPPGGLPISSASTATPSSSAKKSEPSFFQRHIMAGEQFTSFTLAPSSTSEVLLRRVFIRYEPAADESLPGVIHWKTIGDEGKEQQIVLDRDFGRALILGKYHSIWQIEGAASGDALNCFSIMDTSSTATPSSSLHVVADADDAATKWVVSFRDIYAKCKRIDANSYQSI